MYCAHSSWVNGMVDECLVKKEQDKIVIKTFLKYNEAFLEKIIVNLIRNSDEINLKGIMLVLVHGNLAHVKRNSNMRLMAQFAFRGVQALDRERESIGDNYDQVCVKYFEIARRYCLNNVELDKLGNFFKEIDIEIVKLCDEYHPLGFEYRYDETAKPKKERKSRKDDDWFLKGNWGEEF